MATIKELIEYLKTLPDNTEMRVIVEDENALEEGHPVYRYVKLDIGKFTGNVFYVPKLIGEAPVLLFGELNHG